MSINRIDFGVIAASNEVSHVKAAEDSRPLMDRQNFQTQFNEEVEFLLNEIYSIKIKTLLEITVHSNILIKQQEKFHKILEILDIVKIWTYICFTKKL